MKLSGPIPVLSCRSVDESFKFYRDTLQFVEIRSRKGNAGLEWIYLGSGQSFLMLEQRTSSNELEISPLNRDFRLYFYIDDIQNFYLYMKAKGYKITQPEKLPFGLIQSEFYDPDGVKIQVGQLTSSAKI